MHVAGLLLELYGRVPPVARGAVDRLTPDQLRHAPAAGTNPIGWLVWHLARVQDSHIAEVLERPQVWTESGWAARFGLAPDPSNTGYGHTAGDVAAVAPESADALAEYLEAVDRRTRTFLCELVDGDLDRIVDHSWDPPVTLGVRLVSVADDCLQHAGQAAYVRGLLGR